MHGVTSTTITQNYCSRVVQRHVICSIAATDGSGHAGVFNDLRVISDLGGHGCAVITGITCQNSQTLSSYEISSTESLSQQWHILQHDLNPSVLKVGMVFHPTQTRWLASQLQQNPIPVVLDPVISSSAGQGTDTKSAHLKPDDYLSLLPCCTVFTPNIPEAEWLLDRRITSAQEMQAAARDLLVLGASSVLIKGGHLPLQSGYCPDYFCSNALSFWLNQPMRHSPHNRGTGCMLSSAIATFMAHGKAIADAVVLASAYVQSGAQQAFAVGKGRGLLGNTGWPTQLAHFPAVTDVPGYVPAQAFASCDTSNLGLYPVVNSLEWLKKLLKLGIQTLQLRVKNTSAKQLDQLIKQAAQLGHRYNARLFINDYWALAIKHDAYGVHLGQEDLSEANLSLIRKAGLRLGLSAHSEHEWARAATVRPSYIALGSVFPTHTKPVQTIGLNNLEQWTGILKKHFPITAIGGINTSNLDQVLATGIGSVAVVSAITQSTDYVTACQQLQHRVKVAEERAG